MPVLLLIRNQVLSESEISRLPLGCFPISKEDPLFLDQKIVARAEMRAPIAILLKTVFAMGKAFPDAQFGYEEGFQESDKESEEQQEARAAEIKDLEHDSESSIEDVVDDAIEESHDQGTAYSWQELLNKGKTDEAMEVLASVLPLSQTDHVAIHQHFTSNLSINMIFVCEASIRFQWKTMVLKLRTGLRHPDAKVRSIILKAIGLLAGPALLPSVQLLTSDPDESVRKEAARALKRLKRR